MVSNPGIVPGSWGVDGRHTNAAIRPKNKHPIDEMGVFPPIEKWVLLSLVGWGMKVGFEAIAGPPNIRDDGVLLCDGPLVGANLKSGRRIDLCGRLVL